MFDMTRRYARYGEGEPHVFYAFNNIILVTDDEKSLFHMTEDSVAEMMQSGLYGFWLFGSVFYIEVLPLAFNTNDLNSLQQEANSFLIPAKDNEGIFELNDVMETDFWVERFYSKE